LQAKDQYGIDFKLSSDDLTKRGSAGLYIPSGCHQPSSKQAR